MFILYQLLVSLSFPTVLTLFHFYFVFLLFLMNPLSLCCLDQIGIVKDSTQTTARIELHSSCKTISVDRSRLSSVT